ncbi:MAG: hypothetical protein ABEH81_00885 [Halopenitus sp.]
MTDSNKDISRGNQYKSSYIDPVILDRDDDSLKAEYYEGSGITEPEGELVSITRVPDGKRPGLAGYRVLRIPADELDGYIEVLQELRDCIEEEG